MPLYDINGNERQSAYDKNGVEVTSAYNSQGVEVIFGGDDYEVDYGSYQSAISIPVGCRQGFAYWNGLLFILDGSGGLTIVDYNTANTLATFSNVLQGHGNTAVFSYEYYDQNDEFPLLYISKDQGDPCDVYVYRIQRTNGEFSVTLVRTLRWSLATVGYYADGVIDRENHILYMHAYAENSYAAVPVENNHMIITSWSLDSLTSNADGTYTPQYIGRVDCDNYIAARCGMDFKDGLIFTGNGYDGTIYAVKVSDGSFVVVIAPLRGSELEGMQFISKRKLLVGYSPAPFHELTFGYK